MPAIAVLGQMSTGHDGWPATPCIGPVSSTVTINGKGVQLKYYSLYESHTKQNNQTHPATERYVVDTPGNVNTITVEGRSVVMVGDRINCGDTVAGGSADVSGGY